MSDLLLQRKDVGDQGTFGVLSAAGFSLFSGELPPRDNRPQESCIPAGEYWCTWRKSPHLQRLCYHIENVPGRGGILLHSANLFGDRLLGYLAQVLGCIAAGEKLGWLDRQKAVLISAPAVRRIEQHFAGQPFVLGVRDV